MEGLRTLSDEDAARAIERLERRQGTTIDLLDDLHAIAEAGRCEGRTAVERYLGDPDPDLRAMALSVVTFHWHLSEHWDTCARMGQEDSDADVRGTAVAGLGSLRTATKDPATLRVLIRIFDSPREDPSVRMISYASILRVLGYHIVDGLALRVPEPADVRRERIAEAKDLAGDAQAG